MLLIVLVCSLSLTATGQQVQDGWIDPHDMFNYDPSTNTMRKHVKPNLDIVKTVITGLQDIGEFVTEFHRAFKDLPGHLQITVSTTAALCILVFIYLNCRPQRDPPPAQPQEPEDHIQEIEDRDHLAGEDAPQPVLRQQDSDDQLHRNQVRQRRVSIPREEPGKAAVKTLRPAEPHNSEDEKDARLSEQEQNPAAESDSENQQETQEERAGASASGAAANTAQSETGSGSSPSPSETAERRPSQTDVQDLQASAQDSNFSASLEQIETLLAPVQETRPIVAE